MNLLLVVVVLAAQLHKIPLVRDISRGHKNVDEALLDIERKRHLCGPLSVWYVLNRLGDEISAKEVVQKFNTLEKGASLASLADELESYGVKGEWRRTDERTAKSISDLSLLVVGESHCVVLDHFEGGEAVVFEPASQSLMRVPTIDFLASWNGQFLTARKPQQSTSWLDKCLIVCVVLIVAFSIQLARYPRERHESIKGSSL